MISVLKSRCKIWKNEDADISDHLMIGITCGKTEVSQDVKKIEWREKWNTVNAEWKRDGDKVEDEIYKEADQGGRTVNKWELDIKNILKQEANKTIGTKKLKTREKKLKGWWDKEVEEAIAQRKKENRKHRRLSTMMRNQAEHRPEWERAWEKLGQQKRTQRQ